MQTIEITAELGFSGYPDSFPDGPKEGEREREVFFAFGTFPEVADDYAEMLIEKGLAKKATKTAAKAAEKEAQAEAKAPETPPAATTTPAKQSGENA